MNKHIKLFNQIPCGNFGASKLFFDKFKNKQPKDITVDDIFLAYYYISEEMMDSTDSKRFIVQKDSLSPGGYQYHDPLTGVQDAIENNYRHAKVYNGIIKHYSNRTPRKEYYGLVAEPKIQGEKITGIIEDFRICAYNYKTQHFRVDTFTNERRYCLGKEELEHLYTLLKTLIDKANFKYIQPGSIIHQNIVKNSQHTPDGQNFVRQHKEFMFGELKHDDAHFQVVKAMWAQKQK